MIPGGGGIAPIIADWTEVYAWLMISVDLVKVSIKCTICRVNLHEIRAEIEHKMTNRT